MYNRYCEIGRHCSKEEGTRDLGDGKEWRERKNSEKRDKMKTELCEQGGKGSLKGGDGNG